jgi:hypothetical protein
MGWFVAFVADFWAIVLPTGEAAYTLLRHRQAPNIESKYTHDSPLFAP